MMLPRPAHGTAFFLTLPLLLNVADNASAQHDGQRNAVQQIARSRPQAAARELGKNRLPDAAETHFVQMLSLLDQDRPPEALAEAKKAVAAGLPFERLLAGPSRLLAKLQRLPAFTRWQHTVAPSPLLHGPMLGSVTDQSASFWVRTAEPAQVTITLFAPTAETITADDEPVAQATATTLADTDRTAVVPLDGLLPATRYRYRVQVDGQPTPVEQPTFRTFPATDAAAQFVVGFGGGAGYVPQWEKMWDTIRGFDPLAMLMLGDNVYIDDPTHLLTQQYCYYRRQSRPEWRRLTSSTAIFSIYDDHDFGTNDCEPGPAVARPAWKRPVVETFRHNWVNPGYGGGQEHPGCWYDFRIADVHFIMLDGRYYRDRASDSMLGSFQKAWLFETLRRSDATFKVIASPVPFTPGIKPGSPDPWDGYPKEREEIFSFLEKEQVDGVFLIAADRHRTDLRKIARPQGYTLYEFESSRLTNHHTHRVVETDGLIWGYNETCSFALMRFDTTAADPQVRFEAIDLEGQLHASHVLRRSELEPRGDGAG